MYLTDGFGQTVKLGDTIKLFTRDGIRIGVLRKVVYRTGPNGYAGCPTRSLHVRVTQFGDKKNRYGMNLAYTTADFIKVNPDA